MNWPGYEAGYEQLSGNYLYGRGQRGSKRLLQQLNDFWLADWWRPMFNKGTDHGNEVMMAHFVFFLSDAPRTSKIVDVLVNTKSTIMSMVCTFSEHRNDQEMVKTFKTLQRNISPAAHGYT